VELAQKFRQIPQLSVGGEYNLRQPVSVSSQSVMQEAQLTWTSSEYGIFVKSYLVFFFIPGGLNGLAERMKYQYDV
jgi:outer membrane lipopolysaccharide assembly protein LptE/RlpB